MNSTGRGEETSKRILHLNSPTHVLRFIENYCESKALKVDSTESEATAFHLALIKKYRLILIGLQTPKVNPIRIIKGLIRAKVRTPVLLVSEFPSRDEPRFAAFQNVLGIIGRPIEIKVLSSYLQGSNRPQEFDTAEKEKLITILRKWESEVAIGS